MPRVTRVWQFSLRTYDPQNEIREATPRDQLWHPSRLAPTYLKTLSLGHASAKIGDVDGITQIEEALNRKQRWLSIVPRRNADGSVDLVVNIHGHSLAAAAGESPEDVREGLLGVVVPDCLTDAPFP